MDADGDTDADEYPDRAADEYPDRHAYEHPACHQHSTANRDLYTATGHA